MADEEEELEKNAGKASSSGKLMQIIMLVLLLAALGLGGFNAWTIHSAVSQMAKKQIANGDTGKGKNKGKAKHPKLPAILVPMDALTVNLADEGESRYLHVKIEFSVEGKVHEATFNNFVAPIKDMIITTLSSKKIADIRTQQGKFALKQEIAYRINKLIGDTIVKKIYFSDFVIQ